jgi:hypothetical protein
MKTPISAHCELCRTNLTAKVKLVDREMGKRGIRRMSSLVAPPRIVMTFDAGKRRFLRVYLCPTCYGPSSVAVMMDRLLETGRLPTP